ncbi:MAG TPA: YceI family protein [Chitinophagaceae bacterium]|jgi:polyisoprenoid-binding protein YceI|nr:YceI family protein [Chitinophagaceae bacterium]
MKKTRLLFVFMLAATSIFSQKKTTATASVGFDATTPKDALPKAENKTVIGSFDTKTGTIAFEAAVKNFSFSNPQMQSHFNGANWMNSDQFPKFTYTGTIEKFSKIKLSKNGVYSAKVNGDMTIKGITKKVKVEGKITVAEGKVSVNANFNIKLSDFGISGQPITAGKVHTDPKISVAAVF